MRKSPSPIINSRFINQCRSCRTFTQFCRLFSSFLSLSLCPNSDSLFSFSLRASDNGEIASIFALVRKAIFQLIYSQKQPFKALKKLKKKGQRTIFFLKIRTFFVRGCHDSREDLMDSVDRSAVTPKKGRLARAFAKVIHLRAATGIAPVDGIQKIKVQEKVNKDDEQSSGSRSRFTSFDGSEEKLQNRAALEALLAKLFASVSSVKAAYAQLQVAQSPYDGHGIQSADQMVVTELKSLSELKQCYLKKQFDSSPENMMILAEIQEQKSLLKTYEIMMKKLESQVKLKGSDITFLREKLEESKKQSKSLEKRLSSSGPLYVLENLHLSGLNPSHFNTVLRHAIKSIRSFVRLMVKEMESAGWDFDAATSAIEPGVVYWKDNHKCFTFESFVCREMFDAFHYPNFSLPNEALPEQKKRKQLFFERFTELKYLKPKEFLAQNPKSTFAKFCRAKYLRLVHPKMESSLFGNLNQRNLVNSGENFPETPFFASFAEMAKRVWLLHCLAFSFEPEASIFRVSKNCRFSEMYMESVTDEAFFSPENTPESDPGVAFTVVPGFRIGKTVIQCQVYLSKHQGR